MSLQIQIFNFKHVFCSLQTTDPLIYVPYLQFVFSPLDATKSYTPDIHLQPVINSYSEIIRDDDSRSSVVVKIKAQSLQENLGLPPFQPTVEIH